MKESSVIKGVVLGDGHLCKERNRITVTNTNKDFLYHLSTILPQKTKVAFRNSGEKQKEYSKNLKNFKQEMEFKDVYSLRINGDFHDLNYYNVDLTTFKYWYICDGSLNHKNKVRRPTISISSLREDLEKINYQVPFNVKINKERLYVSANDTAKFLKNTESVPGFEYKWSKSVTDKQIQNRITNIISKKINKGKSYREISDKLNTTHTTISNWYNEKTTPEYQKYLNIIKYYN